MVYIHMKSFHSAKNFLFFIASIFCATQTWAGEETSPSSSTLKQRNLLLEGNQESLGNEGNYAEIPAGQKFIEYPTPENASSFVKAASMEDIFNLINTIDNDKDFLEKNKNINKMVESLALIKIIKEYLEVVKLIKKHTNIIKDDISEPDNIIDKIIKKQEERAKWLFKKGAGFDDPTNKVKTALKQVEDTVCSRIESSALRSMNKYLLKVNSRMSNQQPSLLKWVNNLLPL